MLQAIPQERQEVEEQQQEVEEQQQEVEERLSSPPILEPNQVGSDISLKNTAKNFYGGKMADCLQEWRKLTSDKWILSHVMGFTIEFKSQPRQFFQPFPLRLSAEDQRALHTALISFVDQGIVERCQPVQDMFLSTVFPVMKKDGSARIILNLSKLNECVDNHHFKMDTIREAIALMRPNCFFASIDFKHAYYSVLVAECDRKYLCFEWNGQLFRFRVLPQGLSSSPRVFTKMLKPALAYLRHQSVIIIIYIDDSLIIDTDEEHCSQGIREALTLFDRLGLTVSVQKSVLTPVHRIEFLGFILDSTTMTVELTQSKKRKIKNLGQKLLKQTRVTIQALAEFIGNVVAADPAVQFAPLHYKGLEITRNDGLKKAAGNYMAYVNLSLADRADITWWVEHIHNSRRSITIPAPDFTTESDASTKGWGAHFQGLATGGDWSREEATEHINVLELRAALLTLQSFCSDFRDCHIRLMMDNTTAIACVNKQGSTKPRLFQITREVWAWAQERNIWLSAAHIPGVDNVIADRESRTHNLDMEWRLQVCLFQRLCAEFGVPEVDAFASRLNAQLPEYIAWRPDPGACAIDAFSISWKNRYIYAFPPFSLITQILHKLDAEGGEMLLVMPVWPTKPWYPMVAQRLVARPILLPRTAMYLPQQPELKHRLQRTLRLVACRLSGVNTRWKDYQKRLFHSSSVHGEMVRNANTRCTCDDGYGFVIQGKFLCWHRV